MWFCVFPFNSVQMSSRGNTLLVKVKKVESRSQQTSLTHLIFSRENYVIVLQEIEESEPFDESEATKRKRRKHLGFFKSVIGSSLKASAPMAVDFFLLTAEGWSSSYVTKRVVSPTGIYDGSLFAFCAFGKTPTPFPTPIIFRERSPNPCRAAKSSLSSRATPDPPPVTALPTPITFPFRMLVISFARRWNISGGGKTLPLYTRQSPVSSTTTLSQGSTGEMQNYGRIQYAIYIWILLYVFKRAISCKISSTLF